MKIKCKIEITKDGIDYKAGSIVDVPSENVSKWIEKGWGEKVVSKEEKSKKETKELKVKKETK